MFSKGSPYEIAEKLAQIHKLTHKILFSIVKITKLQFLWVSYY